jgi:hypothetical protein
MSANAAAAPKPLVVLVCTLPLFRQILEDELAWLCHVQHYPAERSSGIFRFLEALQPDAVVVVEGHEEVPGAEKYARAAGVPLFDVEVDRGRVRRLKGEDWIEMPLDSLTVPTLSDLLAAELALRARR